MNYIRKWNGQHAELQDIAAGGMLNYHSVLLHQALTKKLKLNSVALVRERTIPTERPPPVGEVSANFCG